jgi:hypothetical protein
MYFHNRFASLLLALALVSPLAAQKPAPKAVIHTIDAAELKMHLDFLASQELGGRANFSPGLKIAGRYLATRLHAYGYKGAGPGGDFFQRFDLVTVKADPERSLARLTTNGQTQEFKFPLVSALSTSDADVTGKLAFVGRGISAPEQGRDDYAGIDVRGRIVVIVSGTPKGIDTSKLRDEQRGPAAAKARGAVGVILMHGESQYKLVLEASTKPDFAKNVAAAQFSDLAADKNATFPQARPRAQFVAALAGAFGMTVDELYDRVKDGKGPDSRLSDATVHLTLGVQRELQQVQNVIATLEGTDPQLKKEYVAFSAHYDHLRTKPDGTIYPGADDDASGTAAVLEIAKTLSENRPKRSVYIIFHAAEELGLYGAVYNTEIAPAVPLDRIVTLLNLDMIGRSKPASIPPGDEKKYERISDANTIYVVGADRASAELQQVSVRANESGEKLRLDYTYNDPKHPEQIYFRSDHWLYAKHGVPIIFYFDGVGPDYHQTTDTPEKIDYSKLTRVSRLVFATGWELANRPQRPKMNTATAGK